MEKDLGSVALISILLISAILIILVTAMSDSSINTSYQYLNNESDKNAYYYAEACLEETLLRIEQDPSFSSMSHTIGDAVCTVTVSAANPKDVNISITYANYTSFTQNYYASVVLTVNGQAYNVSLLKWEKI